MSSSDEQNNDERGLSAKPDLNDSEEVITVNDSDDESNKSGEEVEAPNGAECLRRCKEFASITGTDNALAMFYLQDQNWNLNKGLNAYYQTTQNNKNKKVVACFDMEKLDEDERRESSATSSRLNASDSSSPVLIQNESQNESKSQSDEDEDKKEEEDEEEHEEEETTEEEANVHFKILSWNIDGLDDGNLESRTIGVVNKIINESPDIVLLQEVVRPSEAILRDRLGKLYEFNSANMSPSSLDPKNYYTMSLNKKSKCSIVNKAIIRFGNSAMNRNILQVRYKYRQSVEFIVLNAHLESTKDFAKQRIEQLKQCFNHMLEQNDDVLVFFGGDLNLRDTELNAIGGVPSGLYDIWESTGSRKECLYTWDCSRNTNLRLNSKFKPKCRFDRLYYKPVKTLNSKELTLVPVYFELEGLEKLKSCGRFCSDHWAIQAYCEMRSTICRNK